LWLRGAETGPGRVIQWIFFLWLVSFYSLFAGEVGDESTIVAFYMMMLSTYLGFLLKLDAPERFRQLFLRWIVSFFLFMIPALTIPAFFSSERSTSGPWLSWN